MDSLTAIDNFVTSFLTGRFKPKNSYNRQTTDNNHTPTPRPDRAEPSQGEKKFPVCSVKLPPDFRIYFPGAKTLADYTNPPGENSGEGESEVWEDALQYPADIQRRIEQDCISDQFSEWTEMSKPFPYTYISCPCTDTSIPEQSALQASNNAGGGNENAQTQQGNTEEDEEKTFDPRSPRANYSLYPPEHLLYCEDCHQIKCPRCVTEEIVCWYCPNCLFETPSSMVKSEGNR